MTTTKKANRKDAKRYIEAAVYAIADRNHDYDSDARATVVEVLDEACDQARMYDAPDWGLDTAALRRIARAAIKAYYTPRAR